MDEKKRIIQDKAGHYCSKEIIVHITLHDTKFYNGVLIDVNDARILIEDRKLGEVYVSLEEVQDIEPYEVRGGSS